MEFLDNLFTPKDAESLRKVWGDEDIAYGVARQIGRRMWDSPEILLGDSLNQLVCMLETPQFKHTAQETMTVAGVVHQRLRDIETESSETQRRITLEINKEFGGACLIGLGFFSEAFQIKYQRYNYPHPDYYRRLGGQALYHAGEEGVADNFGNWEDRLAEVFAA